MLLAYAGASPTRPYDAERVRRWVPTAEEPAPTLIIRLQAELSRL